MTALEDAALLPIHLGMGRDMLAPMTPRAAALLAVAGAVVAGGCASEGIEPAARAAPTRVEASIAEWRWAPDPEAPKVVRRARPRRTETTAPSPAPVAGPVATAAPAELPEPPRPGTDVSLVRAEVLGNGIALPPLEAPPEVRAIFEAGNVIARSPYKWGGGHGRWQDTGYDCSGSVSYALAAAGLLEAPLASGPLMAWGRPGEGRWVTIYTNPGHVFLVVAGVRFDTVANARTGSRWTNEMTDTSGYVARHPAGL